MKNQHILFTAPGVAELLEREMPVPGDGEVLVKEVYSPVDAPEVFGRLATSSYFPVTQFDWSLLK